MMMVMQSTLTMSGISAAQFGAPEQDAFLGGMADAAGGLVQKQDVSIVSFADSARRAGGINVGSTITIVGGNANPNTAADIQGKLANPIAITAAIQNNAPPDSPLKKATVASSNLATVPAAPANPVTVTATSSSGLSGGVIAGIVIGSIIGIVVVVAVVYFVMTSGGGGGKPAVTAQMDSAVVSEQVETGTI